MPVSPTVSQLGGWSRATKVIASLLLAWHVAAIYIAPMRFASRVGNAQSSPVAESLGSLMQPYVGLLFLDHGYAFFAPNPGPSHLVDYKIEFTDQREPITGRFPDLAKHRPRLLYHRHFMLSESLFNTYTSAIPETLGPLDVAAELSPSQLREMERRQEQLRETIVAANQQRLRQYEALRLSFERHLLAAYEGNMVTLTLVEHSQRTPDEFQIVGQGVAESTSFRMISAASPSLPPPRTREPEIIRP